MSLAQPSPQWTPLLFHHVPKTAGTSLVEVLRAIYGRSLVALYDHGHLARARQVDPLERGKTLGLDLSTQCVATHGCEVVVPALPECFEAFTLLRHPVDRVVSLYYYARSIAERDAGAGGAIGRTILERGWSLDDVYDRLGGGQERQSDEHLAFWDFFNGQARHLLRPWAPIHEMRFGRGLPVCANEMLEVFEALRRDRYAIGVQEESERSVALFARRFGWTAPALPRRRATPDRPNTQTISDATRRRILDHNRLDLELWQRARTALAASHGSPGGALGA